MEPATPQNRSGIVVAGMGKIAAADDRKGGGIVIQGRYGLSQSQVEVPDGDAVAEQRPGIRIGSVGRIRD
jgi:hypothetical protein